MYFDRDYIKSVDCFEYYGYLNILPIQVHEVSFHFFASFSNSFIQRFIVFRIHFFYLLGYVSSYEFYSLWHGYKCNVSLSSLSDSSLLVYWKLIDFCILILYFAALLNSFLISNSLLEETLMFSIHGIMSSVNNVSFTYSLPIWMPLFLLLGRRQWQPTPVLLPGKSRGRKSLVGCSPWGR